MNDLSDDAKALFDAGRHAQEPTERDRERVRTALLVRIGGAAATLTVAQTGTAAALGQGAALASGGKVVLALKLAVGLALAGGTGTVAYRSLSPGPGASQSPPRSAVPVGPATSGAHAPRPALPLPVRPDARQEPRALRPTATPAAKVLPPEAQAEAKAMPPPSPAGPKPSNASSVVAPEPEPRASRPGASPSAGAFAEEPAKSSNLSAEARALSQVQRAVRDGRSAEALTLLDQQERDFPSGELRQERVAARVVALCAVGRASEARALAESFLARAPLSPLATRMRTICAE